MAGQQPLAAALNTDDSDLLIENAVLRACLSDAVQMLDAFSDEMTPQAARMLEIIRLTMNQSGRWDIPAVGFPNHP